jgi:hypothetical protein
MVVVAAYAFGLIVDVVEVHVFADELVLDVEYVVEPDGMDEVVLIEEMVLHVLDVLVDAKYVLAVDEMFVYAVFFSCENCSSI